MNHNLFKEGRNFVGRLDPERCRVAIRSEGAWPSWHQCKRKANSFRCVDGEEGEIGFCRQHDPVAVKKRTEVRDAAWRAKWEADKARWRLERAAPHMRDALRRIAEGHNDPRSLAHEVLAQLEG